MSEVVSTIHDAPVAIFATHELRIIAINHTAAPAFAQDPEVVGKLWPDFLREYWTPDAAIEVTQIIEKTLETGIPFSSLAFTGTRAADGRQERYDWEVHRIVTADRKRMLVCYFVGPRT